MSKEIWVKPKRPCDVGGEALIEGVMMRSGTCIASAIRKADGEIVIEKRNYIPWTKRNKILGIPIIRGAVGLFDSLIVGMKALMNSAEYFEIEDDQTPPSKFEQKLEKLFGDKLMSVMLYFSVFIAVMLSVALFMLLPNFIASFTPVDKSTTAGNILANLIEGAIRITLFFSYIILVSKMRDIRRVFEYHGAEHKTIYCYECEEELTVENARKHTRFHPRCGTAFLFVVIVISIIVFIFAKWYDNKLINMGIRLLLLPFVAGISYEFIKFAGKSKLKIMRILSMPGLFLQRFTTQEPDDSQLEVAIAALKASLGIEEEKTEIVEEETSAARNETFEEVAAVEVSDGCTL